MRSKDISDVEFVDAWKAFTKEINKELSKESRLTEVEASKYFMQAWDSQFGYGPFLASDVKSVMNEMRQYFIE